MSCWPFKKKVGKSEPGTRNRDENLEEELFSTAGDYGLRTLAEGSQDTVEYAKSRNIVKKH